MVELTLRAPMFISSRLMAAVHIGDTDGTIHLEPVRRDGDDRMVWHYVIEDGNGNVLADAADLRSGASDDIDAHKTMATLVGFLQAAAESYRYTMAGHNSDNADLFAPETSEWAYQHDDQLAALADQLEETERPARCLRVLRRYFTLDDIADGEIDHRDQATDEIDCEPDPHDPDNDETAVTIAAEALHDLGCTQPSTGPGLIGIGDWWSDPDGSYIVNHYTGLRCETAAFPEGFTTDELNAINNLL